MVMVDVVVVVVVVPVLVVPVVMAGVVIRVMPIVVWLVIMMGLVVVVPVVVGLLFVQVVLVARQHRHPNLEHHARVLALVLEQHKVGELLVGAVGTCAAAAMCVAVRMMPSGAAAAAAAAAVGGYGASSRPLAAGGRGWRMCARASHPQRPQLRHDVVPQQGLLATDPRAEARHRAVDCVHQAALLQQHARVMKVVLCRL